MNNNINLTSQINIRFIDEFIANILKIEPANDKRKLFRQQSTFLSLT